MEESIQSMFQYFHTHPELPQMEEKTTNFIEKNLLEIEGVEVERFDLCYGLLAKIQGGNKGKKIVFRADIDALPIKEESLCEFHSKNPGVSHACGHDIHICVGIELARKLSSMRERLCGTIYFLFQPEEENGLGAKKVLASNKLNDMDYCLSLHTNPNMDCGEIGIKSGAITANVNRMKIVLEGIGCHGAEPQNGKDPIVAATMIVQDLQTIVSRNIDPAQRAVVSVTHIESGKDWNVIPSRAILEGTIRTFDEETREIIKERISCIVNGISKAHELHAQVEIIDGPIATNNDLHLVSLARKYGNEKGLNIVEGEQSMVGEDFAFIQRNIPGMMVWLGVGKGPGLHNPKYQANPSAIKDGVKFFEGFIQVLMDDTYTDI